MVSEKVAGLRWVAGSVFLVVALALGYYYATFEKTNLELVTQTQERFYQPLKLTWLAPDIDRLKEQTDATPADEFDILVLRTALGRWRIKETAPTAYERLIRSYEKGYWSDQFTADLNKTLEHIDQRWLEARQESLLQGSRRGMLRMERAEKNSMVVRFQRGVTTADVGSLVELMFTCDKPINDKSLAYLAWTTRLDPELRSYRHEYCHLTEAGTSGTQRLYSATLDLSESPLWLNPVVQPDWCLFFVEGDYTITGASYKTGDSGQLLP